MPDLLAAGLPLPVEAQSARQQADGAGSDSGWNQNDPFSRTDKWIGNPPQPSFEKWRDRESEVLNWAQYVADLSAWASQASLQFGTEILQASRSATLIHAFMEGVDIQAMTSDGSAGTSANGYELLRQLTPSMQLVQLPVRKGMEQEPRLPLPGPEGVPAELYAIQHLTQEAVAFSHFVHRVLFGLGEIEEKEQVDIVLESDSSSALQLIGAVDLPRRSRHIDIKLTWLKERVSSNEVQLRHRAGTQNVADLFTKCLGTRDFLRHRAVLGFMQADMPLNELWLLAEAFHVSNQASGSNNPDYLMVEVCCAENSNLRLACERSNIMYVGITANMETKGIKQRVAHLVKMKRSQGFWIHVHVSTPCKTGSPLQHFRETEKLSSEEQQTWEQVMEATTHYLRLGDVGSFELPLYNNIWGGHLLFV
ncbi:unnamed protein product [Durusdinium trenchii]|uniref:Uncharacterized protein n=1 Tax=Durusdinium trenchii TaxID=1381693 RepID=A0ABP0PMT0_9DINO